jgi:hypothetical protein
MPDGKTVGAAAATRPFNRDNETERTYWLKWAAWEWLYTIAQCRCIGMEVRLEGPGGRVVDLVGVGPGNTIYVVEVKSSRSDFSRDNHTADDLAALAAQGKLVAGRTELARKTLVQATVHAQKVLPDAWREVLAYRQALADFRRVVGKERAYRTRLATYSIKFHDDRFLKIADYHYIIAPRQTVTHRWLPPQWGLLDDTPRVVVPAPRKSVRKNTGIVSNVLRGIARSNTTSMMRAQGVVFAEGGAALPDDGTENGGDEPVNAETVPAVVAPDARPSPVPEVKNGRSHHRSRYVRVAASGSPK